jgi:ATP-dependent DNA helicase PIF1
MVDQICRTLREVDAPFGGIQVILCGDFFQLPPISREGEPDSSFVVSSSAWRDLDPVVCYLSEQHRQDDDEYLSILTALRQADLRRRHVEALMRRQFTDVGEATELHTTNVDVDAINAQKLQELAGDEHNYYMTHTGKANYVESLSRSCLANEELVLKKGALVMCIKNSQDKKYVNGSLGAVVGFEKGSDYPIVELKNGRTITITPETWELRDGDKKRASITQLPLRLAWAITVHKSQGMTLDAARIDLRRAFVEGMGYVALSRVRSLKTLSLHGINRMALQISPSALEIDKSLRAKSAMDSKRLEYLRANSKKRAQVSEQEKPPSGWSDKVEKMRELYPNAYRPWAEADDRKLIELFSDGQNVSVKTMTKVFGRHPGSIRARLKKHFGEDALTQLRAS